MKESLSEAVDPRWKALYRIGGTSALAAVAVAVLETLVIIVTGKLAGSYDASEWFAIFRKSRLLGLLDCAVLDIAIAVLLVPLFLALYAVLRRGHPSLAAIAAALAILGIAVYIPTNRAIFLLDASDLYAAAASDAARAMYLAQGQALMGYGRFGMFWSAGFFIMAAAVLVLSCAMLRDRPFKKACGYVGILASSLILANGFSLAFVPVDVGWTSTILGGSGGLLSFAWWILVGLRLRILGRVDSGLPR
jgi:hypothetical protein